jgi:hypothetical protein
MPPCESHDPSRSSSKNRQRPLGVTSSDRGRCQSHLVSETLKLLGESSFCRVVIQLGEVIRSFLLVGFTRFDHLIVNDQDAMADCDSSAFTPTPSRKAAILSPQVRLCRGSCMGSLHQDSFDPPMPLTNAYFEAFATSFIIAWTDSNKRSQVSCIRKGCVG